MFAGRDRMDGQGEHRTKVEFVLSFCMSMSYRFIKKLERGTTKFNPATGRPIALGRVKRSRGAVFTGFIGFHYLFSWFSLARA